MSSYEVHEFSIVSDGAIIGENTRVWQFCNIMKGAVIGKNCNIGQGAFIEDGVVLGNNVKVKNNVSLYSGVICEDDVFIGPNCVFTNVINPRSFIEKKNQFKETVIKKGATLGANSTIVCGHTIGEYALIGAGTVVTKDVPDYSLVIGNPGKIVGYVCRCGEKISFISDMFECKYCGKKYDKLADVILEH